MSWHFNKPPDEKFKGHFRSICLRPAMYVGEANYKVVAALLEGMALGYQDWHGGFFHSLLHEEFQQFLAKKYRREGSQFEQVVWSYIIPLGTKQDGENLTEKELISRLLADFEDFNNILVRLAVETGNGVGRPEA
jgi:hypothetical protein